MKIWFKNILNYQIIDIFKLHLTGVTYNKLMQQYCVLFPSLSRYFQHDCTDVRQLRHYS